MKKFLSLFLMLTVVTIVMATLLSCQKSDMLGDADDSILSIDTTKESSKNSETNFYNETGTNTSSTPKPELSAEEKWNTKASKGLAFTSNNDGTCLVSGKGSCSDFYIIIPTHSSKGDLVIGIGSYAFMNCEEITSVSMPDSIKSIGSGAFSNCSRLTSVAMGNGVKEIGRNAFYECSALNSINIPNSVSNIGEYAFSGCCGLTSINIPGSVMSIGGSAFSHCSRLKSVTISDGVKEIGVATFDCCISLTSVTIPKSVTEIETNAFVDCDALDTINYTGTEMQWSSIDKRYAEIPKSVIINYNYGK